MKQKINLFSLNNPLLYQRNKPWCCDFFDMDGIVCDMNTLFVATNTHSRFCRENSHFLVSQFENLLRSWYHHSEDMSPWENLSLKPAKCVDTRCIASNNHHISSFIEKFFYSLFRQRANLISAFFSVWSILAVHLEDHRNIWKFLLECFHHHLSTES